MCKRTEFGKYKRQEEEHKQLWCPMGRSYNCIGSQCAMWRESYRESVSPSEASIVHGYCGLAGTP